VNYKLSQITELPDFVWHCEPPRWGFDHEGLFLEPAAQTDFWQRTYYGFSADNGHFYYAKLTGDFVVATTVHSRPHHQYDQAGLMVRQTAECWIKTSVEFEPVGHDRLGVVVTQHGYSDWSTQDLITRTDEISVRIARTGSEFLVSAHLPKKDWTQLRVLRFACDPTEPLAVGPYACSPKGPGFRCAFTELTVETPSSPK